MEGTAVSASRLRDVAARAGVSIRTVSNVVNGYAPVTDGTRRRVEAAVAELDYRPNLLARNLKQGRTGMLALVVPELGVPYFTELVQAIIAEARRHNYSVIIDQTDGEPERERELIMQESGAAMFDGVILSPLALSPADLANREATRPLVLLGERVEASTYDHVAIDNISAASAATGHLLDTGRTRVAAIGDQPYETGETAQLRTRGFRQAHSDRNRPVDESLVVGTRRFHYADGAAAMIQLLEHPTSCPDAVFCYNDLLAIGAMRAIAAHGLRVPDDVAVVGFDDIEAGRFHTPSLSTIAPDKASIARLAVDRLMTRLGAGPAGPPAEMWAPYELVVRESSGS